MGRGPGKFTQVEVYPLEMSNGDLAGLLGSMANSKVMRTLLMAEVQAIRGGAERERRTMRNMWYDYIKPVLSRSGLLDKDTRNGNGVDWPALLSRYLGEMVRDGATSYEELSIVDGSRQRQVATAITHTVADVQLVGAHYPWLILFTEKDTIWGELASLASLYGVSAISGGGEPSQACTENTVKAILRSDGFQTAPAGLVVLSLTDYDPFGYTIARAQFDQVREAAGDGVNVSHERLGLLPSQLTPEERQAKAYKPKDNGFEAWYAETGGVDGQALGLELDALPLSRLRRMFAEGIEQHIDLERRRDDLRAAFVDLLAWELLQPELDARRRAMMTAITQNGLWAHIQNTAIPGDLFKQAAVAGWNSINPDEVSYRGKALFDCGDRTRAAMREALTNFGPVAR
jgi:hypothetical protein